MNTDAAPLIDRDGPAVALVCSWYDGLFIADRGRAFQLWSDGSLYWSHRDSPAAVWSPPHYLGHDHDLASARRMALTGQCRHERLAPPSPAVTAYLAERGGWPTEGGTD